MEERIIKLEKLTKENKILIDKNQEQIWVFIDKIKSLEKKLEKKKKKFKMFFIRKKKI